jgi:hypothetical protein
MNLHLKCEFLVLTGARRLEEVDTEDLNEDDSERGNELHMVYLFAVTGPRLQPRQSPNDISI